MNSTLPPDDRRLLSAFLARCMLHGWIGPTEAASLRTAWSGAGESLPLEPVDWNLSSDALAQAALALRSLSPRFATGQPDLDAWRAHVQALRLRALLDLHEKAQDRYARQARHWGAWLIAGLASGALGLARWQTSMNQAVQTHLLGQAWLGSAGQPRDLAVLERTGRRELTYVQRFADLVALRQLQGRPLSQAQLISRALLYGGTARAEFSEQVESRVDPLFRTPAGLRPGTAPGLVCEYISCDDAGVCGPCHVAQHEAESYGGITINGRGYYRVGRGPRPGTVCLGGALCRCRRVVRWDPDVWRLLM